MITLNILWLLTGDILNFSFTYAPLMYLISFMQLSWKPYIASIKFFKSFSFAMSFHIYVSFSHPKIMISPSPTPAPSGPKRKSSATPTPVRSSAATAIMPTVHMTTKPAPITGSQLILQKGSGGRCSFPLSPFFHSPSPNETEYPSYVEEASTVQFSPRGGNGTVLASSDAVVPVAGLEPARLAALDFESSTSTNSITPANSAV